MKWYLLTLSGPLEAIVFIRSCKVSNSLGGGKIRTGSQVKHMVSAGCKAVLRNGVMK